MGEDHGNTIIAEPVAVEDEGLNLIKRLYFHELLVSHLLVREVHFCCF